MTSDSRRGMSNALHYTESITIKYLNPEVLSNDLGNNIGFKTNESQSPN